MANLCTCVNESVGFSLSFMMNERVILHSSLSAGVLELATVYISVSVFVRTREKGGEEEKRFEGLT